jgi:predicted RNase H-like HicB family nuclease
MEYLVIFEKSDDNSIWARVPDLTGCYSCGDTIEEAKVSIKDAISLYLEDLKEEGKQIPARSHLQAEMIEV